MRIGVVGHGFVGKSLARFFGRKHEVFIYDKFLTGYSSASNMQSVNSCDLAFLAVPTPTAEDGLSCDISCLSEALSWLKIPTCIKSTVPPGTTKKLGSSFGSALAFSPEYIGESSTHCWKEPDDCGFVIVGGDNGVANLVIVAYQHASSMDIEFKITDSTTAELVKYMENSFLATKVAFVNQFYDLAESLKIDFHELRQLWLMDSRIGTSHTTVRNERGFGGRCLPKDLRSLIAVARVFGGAPLLEAVLSYNVSLCESSKAERLADFFPRSPGMK